MIRSPFGRSLLAALALSVLSCTGAPPEPSSAPLDAYRSVSAEASCAPWDGPAVMITLAAAEEDGEPAPPFVQVLVYEGMLRLEGTTVAWPDERERGFARTCVTAGSCATADSAVVMLEALRGDSLLPGRLRLAFGDGTVIDGAFRARWNPRVALCP